jgi:hypothetical protein
MNTSAEADTLTNTLLSTIRLQRHLGTRVIISTQEPTISPALLDLSSVTIVHRFTSPEWLRALKVHLAAASSDLVDEIAEERQASNQNNKSKKIFHDIVNLQVGEALLFAPSAMTSVATSANGVRVVEKLGTGYLKINVRARITEDGGKSAMAS